MNGHRYRPYTTLINRNGLLKAVHYPGCLCGWREAVRDTASEAQEAWEDHRDGIRDPAGEGAALPG